MKNQITPVKGKWYVDNGGDVFEFFFKKGKNYWGSYGNDSVGVWYIAEIKREATKEEITEAKKQMG